jgi:ferredoxin
MRVQADRSLCCGGGQCVLSAPELFDQDEMGIVLVLKDLPSEAEAARRAAMVLPQRLHQA